MLSEFAKNRSVLYYFAALLPHSLVIECILLESAIAYHMVIVAFLKGNWNVSCTF